MPGKQSFPGILPFMGVFYVQVFIPVSKPIFMANLKCKNIYVKKSTGYLIKFSNWNLSANYLCNQCKEFKQQVENPLWGI